MIAFKDKIVDSPILKELELQEEAFILMTIHRSDTMDCEEELIEVKDNSKGILVEPVDNFSFQKFEKKSQFAITENDDIRDDASVQKIPYLMLRSNTSILLPLYWMNILVPINVVIIRDKSQRYRKKVFPPLWNGQASEIFTIINQRQRKNYTTDLK